MRAHREKERTLADDRKKMDRLLQTLEKTRESRHSSSLDEKELVQVDFGILFRWN